MNIYLCGLAVVTGGITFGMVGATLLATSVGIAAGVLFRRPRAAPSQASSPLPASSVALPAAAPSSVSVPAQIPPRPTPAAAVPDHGPSPEILAIIAAVARITFGSSARVSQVRPAKTTIPLIEPLIPHWSMEGRRQIYSSHQIR